MERTEIKRLLTADVYGSGAGKGAVHETINAVVGRIGVGFDRQVG